jgi:hypothetical protein
MNDIRLILTCCLALAACGQTDSPPTNTQVQRIVCASDGDCAARGGTCDSDNQCHAANECTGVGDCAADEVCKADPNFGGLCVTPEAPPVPEPAWACSTNFDCPLGFGCGIDSICRIDGECHADADCGSDGELCYSGSLQGPDDPTFSGICGTPRPSNDPYCRSDGAGHCLSACTPGAAEACSGQPDLCVALGEVTNGVSGFCRPTECSSDDDCADDEQCPDVANADSGLRQCQLSQPGECVDDGHGVCRLPCDSDHDCVEGGSCDTDGLCHASDECVSAIDCPAETPVCYPADHFSGMCGPSR